MAEQQFIMTQKGYDEAVEHLKYLQTVKRQEIVERITEARSHGDLSENAEYDAARNEQAANEEMDEEDTYEITGTTEANPMANKISNESPVGKALLKHKVGDVVKVFAPDGEYRLVIKEIS